MLLLIIGMHYRFNEANTCAFILQQCMHTLQRKSINILVQMTLHIISTHYDLKAVPSCPAPSTHIIICSVHVVISIIISASVIGSRF